MSVGIETVSDAIAAYNVGDVEGYFARHSARTELIQDRSAVTDVRRYREQVAATRSQFPGLVVHIDRLHDAGEVVVMESRVDFGDGRAPQPEAVVFDLAPDGLIDRTRIYSPAPIASQLEQADA